MTISEATDSEPVSWKEVGFLAITAAGTNQILIIPLDKDSDAVQNFSFSWSCFAALRTLCDNFNNLNKI